MKMRTLKRAKAMKKCFSGLLLVSMLSIASPGVADELTQIVQQELQKLGYDPGGVDGEMTTKTAVAISQFQAEHDLEVTGEASPQLVGVLMAVGEGKYQQADPTGTATDRPVVAAGKPAETEPASRAGSAGDLQARQQACLQEKMAVQQKSGKKKKAFGSLMSAASRIGSRFGMGEVASVTNDVYAANATAGDLQSAAKDLGLTEDEVEECRNPPQRETEQ
jgi:peptidoglycan hydrolase-like protein with peptidoglycan-binding domain